MIPTSIATGFAHAAASRISIAATTAAVACSLAVACAGTNNAVHAVHAFASSVVTHVFTAALLCRRVLTMYGYIQLIQFTEKRCRTTYVSWLRRRARSFGRKALQIGERSLDGCLSRPERVVVAVIILLMAPSWIFHVAMTAVYFVLRDAWRVLSFTARRPTLFMLDAPPQLLLSIMAAGARNAGDKMSAAVALLVASRASAAATAVVAVAAVAAVVHAWGVGRPPVPRQPLRPGERVRYASARGIMRDAQVVEVHTDDLQPYYTIRVDGQERSTERSRLFRPDEQDTVSNRLHAARVALHELLRDGMARAAVLPMFAAMKQTEPARATTARLATPNDFLCPITYQLMTDPVIAADGHTYEREAIQHWMRQNPGRRALSPKTQIPLAHQNLQPNIALRGAIEHFVSLNPGVGEEDSE